MASFSACFFALFLCIALFFAGSGAYEVDRMVARTWCIAMPNLSSDTLQRAIDWSCSQPGVNCAALNPGGPCYEPNTLYDHASFALNLFYKAHGGRSPWCPYNTAIQIVTDPSTGTCIYP